MDNANTTLDQALLVMLRPVARFWVRRGEKLQRLVDILKIAMVEAAVEEMERQSEKVTISKISTVSGVHRKDAAKIRKEHNDPPQSVPSIVQRVIGFWSQNEDYRTAEGKPRVLSYSEFEDMLAKVSKSIGPRSVLFELQRSGAVEVSRGNYKLVYSRLKHTQFFDRSMNLVARSVDTMIEAAEENINQVNDSPNLFVRTEFDNVFMDDIPKIRAWIEREGKKFHVRAREFIAKCDADISMLEKREAGGKVVISSFSLTSPVKAKQQEDEEAA
ncbi:MAG: hypothetical protein KDD66_17795 [Bdellovibrionales bacterium]|nr:hypothetical protein [Bdellovibrionales bacterium]